MEVGRQDAERIALAGGQPAQELVLALFDQVALLTDRQETLERRLGQNSRNSSLPPSSDRGQARAQAPGAQALAAQAGRPARP